MIAKLEWTQRNTTTKHRLITESHNGSINQQQINTNRTLERTSAKAAGGLKCILLVPNLHPRLCVVEAHVKLAWWISIEFNVSS